jgi:O-antigen ligase
VRLIGLFVIYYASAGYALLNPLYGVLFFVHIMIFRPENLAWGNPIFGRLHLITAVCTAIGYLIRWDGAATHGRHQRLNIVLFAAFTGWLWFISPFARKSVDLSTERALEVTKIFLLCVLLSLVMTSAYRIRLYVLVSSASFGLLGFWGVLQGMAGNARLDTLWVGGANYLAAGLSLMIPFTLAAASDRAFSWWHRMGLVLCVMAMTLCLIYTSSRGGFLALLGGLLSLLVLAKQRGKLLLGALVVAVIVYPMIPTDYGKRVSVFVQDDAEADLSAQSRPILWQVAFRMWRDNPILGVGLGNFPLVVDSYASESDDLIESQAMAQLIFGRGRMPHGMYTGMLAEAGVIGLAIFLILLLRNALCRLGPRARDLVLLGKGAQAGIAGFAIGAVFGDYIDVLYWQLFLVGAIVSNVRRTQENRDARVKPSEQGASERLR